MGSFWRETLPVDESYAAATPAAEKLSRIASVDMVSVQLTMVPLISTEPDEEGGVGKVPDCEARLRVGEKPFSFKAALLVIRADAAPS